MDTATSEDLDDEAEKGESGEEEGEDASNATAAARGEEENEYEEEEKDEEQSDFYMEDRMSEMKTVANLFANAHGILNNSREFTNYSIIIASAGEQKTEGEENKKGYKVGEKDGENKDEAME